MNVVNKEKRKWIRPWNVEKFDDLYNRDDRFFAVLIKGALRWLNNNVVMYNRPINHFILDTGSSYLYIERNGYEYNLTTTTGEDMIYMQMPRCIVEMSDISFPNDELSNPFSRGNYERRDGRDIRGFNAEIQRIPIEISLSLKYVLSNFNEMIILIQEMIDTLVYQRYFNITYLGQIIQCSIEFPTSTSFDINQIDMTSTETLQKNLQIDVKLCSSYPVINLRSEVPLDAIISSFGGFVGFKSDRIDFRDITFDLWRMLNALLYPGMTPEELLALYNRILELLKKFDLDGNGIIDMRDIELMKQRVKDGKASRQDLIDMMKFIDTMKDDPAFNTHEVGNMIYLYRGDPNTSDAVLVDKERWKFDNKDLIAQQSDKEPPVLPPTDETSSDDSQSQDSSDSN